MYLSHGGYASSRTIYASQGGYTSGSSYVPHSYMHSGVVHSVGPVYMDPAHAAAAEQYRRMKMAKKISGSTITGKPLAYAAHAHPVYHTVLHGGVIDAHTHYASVGLPHHSHAPAAAVIAHHPALPHAAVTESGHYYGRSDYAARKEAEYRTKYGYKYGVFGAGAHGSTLVPGAGLINEELDEYIHSSGTGLKQWLRRRKARKEIKRAVQYELLHQAIALRHGCAHPAPAAHSTQEHAAASSNGTEV